MTVSLDRCPFCLSTSKAIIGVPLQPRYYDLPVGRIPRGELFPEPRELWECQDCRLRRFSYALDQDVIRQLYSADSVGEKWGGRARSDFLASRTVRWSTFRWDDGNRSALDIGSHTGEFLGALPAVWSKAGVEPNPTTCRIAADKLPRAKLIGRTFEEAALEGYSYDLITAWDVAEHVINVRPFFEKVGRLLTTDGIFVLETGNYGSLFARIAGLAWNYYSIPDHVVFYSEDSIRAIAGELDFEVELIERGPHSRIHQLLTNELFSARIKALAVIAYSLRGKYAWPHDALSRLLGKDGSLRNSYFHDHITVGLRKAHLP